MESGGDSIGEEYVKEWIEKAEDDLLSAQSDSDNGLYSNACYSSQQAAEKAVKALLMLESFFAKKHQISGLLSKLVKTVNFTNQEESELEEVLTDLLVVEPYWETARYPVEGRTGPKDLDKADAEEAIERAQSVLKKVKEMLEKRYKINF